MTTETLVLPKYRMYCADSGDLGEGSKLGKIMDGNSTEGESFSFTFPCDSPTVFSITKEFIWMSKRETCHTFFYLEKYVSPKGTYEYLNLSLSEYPGEGRNSLP